MTPPVAARSSSSVIAPTEMPTDSDSCWATLVSVVARLMRAVWDVGEGERVDAGELQRAEEAADEEKAGHQPDRGRRGEARGQRDEAAGDEAH